MIPGLPVSSIPQGKWNHHQDVCLEWFQGIECFQAAVIEAQPASKMLRKVKLPKSRINRHSFVEVIVTSSNEVFVYFESDMTVGTWKLGNPTRETADSNVMVKQNAGFKILTLGLEPKISNLSAIACIFVKLYTRTDCKDWPCKIPFTPSVMHFIAGYLAEYPLELITLRGCSIVGGGRNIGSSMFAVEGCG
jgi:hypothetical protein